MTFETESWYCTNRPEISTPIQVPAFLRNENIVSTLLKMTFQPHGNVLNHSSQYNFNDGLIGSFTNTVPSGQKIFSVPTSNWNNGVAGNVLQIVDTFTQHSNDAHYVSVADYQLEVNIDQATTFVCADSSSSAQAIVQETYACNASTGYVFNPLTDVYWGSVLNAGQNKTTVITANVETDGNVSITSCSTQEACGDPINTQTGVLSFTLADMSFPTSAGNLVFQRSYTSGALENAGVLGHGWTHNHESKLIFPTDPGGIEDYVLFQSVLGNQFLFKNETDGSFTPGPGVIASLTKSSTTPVVYTLTDSQQAVFQFNEDGRLSLRKDVQGHEFDYEYDTEGKLTEVSADNGARFIQLGYDDQDRIDVVSNHASQQVAFVYDSSGDLVSATDVLGQTWTYVYDSNHHMTQANDPAGKETVKSEYDEEGRANRQVDGEGNLIVQIVYNNDGSTTVYDALGHENEHQYNEHNIATETVDPLGRTEIKEFDDNFRPKTITNDANQTLAMEWSADGVNLESKTDAAGNYTDYEYDSLNNLTSVIDPRGNTTTYTYDGKLLTSSEDALGGDTTYTYTPEGYLESVTDTAGRVTSYEYDSFGQRISMTDPSENTWEYTYDPQGLGRLINTTDPRGRVTHNEYNAAGKLVRVTQNYVPAHPQNYQNLYNIVTEYEYDVRGNQVAVTDTYNRTTQYVYDDADRLLQTIDPAGNTTTNAYDEAGRLISTTDPLLHTTTYEYDATGRLVKTINPLGFHSGTTTFNVSNNTSTVTDMLTRQTVFHYDELGRVVEVVDPLGNSTTTTYDENGNVETHTDQLGRTTTYEYDELNRLVKTIDPNGGETETVYDASGNRTAAIDPLDHQMTYTYDSVGRLVATTDPLNRVTQTEYDEFGRRSVSVDAAGRETTYTYDLLDRVIEVTDPDGNTTTTTYDALGNVLTRTDANGNTTTTTYDALNRPLVATDANGNETTNAYDAGGNLISVTDALGQTTTYTYDALNRRKTVTDPLGNTTEYFYDVFGNLLDTEDANEVVTHYEYDELNRQVAVILNHKPGVPADAETNVRYEFDYNEVGNRVSVKDPNCNVTTYGYDALNRVTSKSDPLTNTWTYTYDLAGNRISTIDAKNQTIQYTYDAGGQLTIIDYPGSEPDVTFTYDLTGQRLSMTDGLGTTTWTYDNLNRPTSVTDAFGKTVGYDYDAVGNRVQLIYPDGKTVAYEYDDLNQLTGVTDWDNQDTGYTYDAVGQLESVSLPNGITSQYSYDDAGRLSELQHEAGANTLASYNYAYDPAGNRIQAIEDLVLPIVPPTPTPTFTETNTPSFTPTETYTPSSTASPTETQTLTPTFTPTDTATPTNTPTQVPSPTPTNAPGGTGTTEIKIGETYVLGNDDSGHGNLLVAQNVVLSQEATIQSLSFYVTTAAGNLRLGIYNDANGNPGTLVAKTDEFTPVVGWNTQSVQTPVLLPAGTYWLAYRPESSDLHFRNTWTGDGENSLRYYSYPYGEMPSTFSASAQSADYQFSFYATFTVAVEPGTIYLGEVNVLHFEADGSGNLLIMQETELPNNAVLQSVSFYVTNAVGKVRLGIYDNNWLNRPETLMAETNEFTPVVGWNTVDVQTPTLLPAGTYWLAFLIESDDLEFKYAWVQGLYTGRVYGYPFGEMPSSVSQQPVGVEYHFSLYATFMEDDSLTLPATEILDDFNRTDGSIGGNWSGDAAEFNIASNQLTVTSNHVMIGWNGTSFGADQEAYVTLSRLDTGSANEHGLVLKSQSAGTLQDGAIQVVYDGSGERIRVWTYTPGYGWAKYGSDISVAFVDGDVFSARALSDGWLDMYRNGTLIGKRNLSAWPYMAQGGYIGLKSYQIQDAIVDDFGGGTLEGGEALMGMASSSSGSESLDAATEFIVLSSQFNANAKMDPIFGQSAPAEQKAYITFPPADSGKQNPLEKTQDKETKDGTIQVVFDVTGGRIQILIYDSQKGWVQRGRDISAKFADGDRFRASLQDDGTLEIYRNGKLLAQRKLSSLPQRDVSMISTPELSIDNASFQPVSYRPSGMSAPIPSAPPGAVNELPYLPLPDLPLQQPASLTIDYTYDALHRLTGATFSDGRSFGYTYDAAGNVLELEQDLGPGTVTTTYTYNAANELFTAQKDGTTWNYTYDANGSLTEVLPNGNPGNGAKRYTYNSAGNLVQVEAHNGTDWDTQAEMDYSGLGQRLSMDAAGVIATYVMDGDRPLAAESAGNTTFYLYGLGAIAEKTTAWSYSLPDGTNTPRQLTNSNGEITLSSRYTPWGDTLETYGTGNFSFGYLGGVLDATTGLLYVGNGQYYDPATGRFLTRNVNPDSTNPYAPWNPIGAIVGPLGLIALVFGRKKKGSKAGTFLMLLLVVGSVGMTLAACGSEPTKVTAVFTPINAQTQLVEATLENGDNMTLVVPVTPTTTPGYFCGLAAPTGTNESELNLTLDELVDYIRKTNGASPDYSIVRGQLKRLMEISGNRGLSTNHLAYLYATIQVETNWVDFQEKGDSSYFRRYDGILGNIENGDGERYKGRGFIHLTGRENYRKASEYLNLRVLGDDGKTEFAELEAYPERAFWRPDTPGNSRGYDYSANIAVYAMADGWFTGKSLFDSEFNNPDGSYNFYEARAIINWPGATSNATQRASDLGNGFAEILRKHCQLGGVLPGINCVVCQ